MDSMRSWLAFSIAVHALILALMIFGLPYFHPKPKDMPPMISVELVQVGKETTTNKVSAANKVVQKPEEEQPAPPTPPPPEAKATPQPEPQPEPPQPKPEPQPAPKVPDVDTTVPDLQTPDFTVKPQFKEMPKLADVDTATPELKVPPKVDFKKVPPKPQESSFDSVLKNLTKQKIQEPTDQPPQPQVKNTPHKATGAQAPISANLTASELAALSAQLARCWSLPSSSKDAQNLIVDVDVTVNPDRTLAGNPTVEDSGRMSSDPAFRAAAMAATRALRNPQCSPLELPPDKYQEWQTMTIHFDPKEMLGQ
ncbi:MAG TPA: hypothetical protein VH722_05465 [Alphaproteobacteria bacterium]|nr:hypothetical protein [Alphaproteobacteria bacterium]